MLGAGVGGAENAVAQRDAAANVIVAVVLDHAVAAGVDAGGDLRQPVGAGGARFLRGWRRRSPRRCARLAVVVAASTAWSRLETIAAGDGRALEAGRDRRAGQLGEARLGAGEQAAEAGEAGVGLGDVGIDAARVALGRYALADADLDGGAQLALAGGEGLGQRDHRPIGEDVVPGGDGVQRDPVG